MAVNKTAATDLRKAATLIEKVSRGLDNGRGPACTCCGLRKHRHLGEFNLRKELEGAAVKMRNAAASVEAGLAS